VKKNRRIFCIFTFLFFVSVFSGASFAASNTPPAPAVSNFEGDVSVKPASSDNWEPIKELGLKLKNGSTVRTEQGTAEISCPDGSIFKFEHNTTATLSIDKDGRVQINTAKGSVNAILGKSAIETQIGPDQILQEKYNPKTGETDISCVNGSATLTMPDGTKVALTKGDVITSSPKERSVKVQAGTAEVTKGAKTKSLDTGFKLVTPRNKPFYVRKSPVTSGRYRNMADPFVANDDYAYTEEYYSQQEASPTEESIEDTEEISEQEEPIEDTESTEEQSLQQDDDNSAPEQAVQEAEDSYSDEAPDAGDDGGGDSGGGE
jgi:hypothetical protein